MQEIITACPVCLSSDFTMFLEGKDYFLSGEDFNIQSCNSCGFKFTNPRPFSSQMEKYYHSEKYISHNAHNGGLFEIIYSAVRFFSVRKKYSMIHSVSPGNRFLDVGCGTAELLHYCKKRGMEVMGVEPGENARNFAIEQYALPIMEKIEDLNGSSSQFDCISLWHVLEHLPDLSQSMIEIKHLLQPAGILIIAVPNVESWDATYYNKFWAAYDLPRHLYHFTAHSLKLLMENHNLEIIKMLPQKLDAFYISLLSEQYKTGRKNIVKAFINGIKSNYLASKGNFSYSSNIFIIRRKIS